MQANEAAVYTVTFVNLNEERFSISKISQSKMGKKTYKKPFIKDKGNNTKLPFTINVT
jgi:hypothetical protein